MNTDDPLLLQVRKNVAISYGHKAVLLALAVFGFASLHWLGDQKSSYEKQRTPLWAVTDSARTAIEGVTKKKICSAFEPPDKSATDNWCIQGKKYPTNEQLVSALQDVAEAPVWAQFREEVEASRMHLVEQLEKDPSAENTLYTRFADLIAKKETYAKASVNAVRRSVAARLATIDLAPDPPKPSDSRFGQLIEPALDENSDTFIMYQILWYASLLLGVVASSLLFVVLLTALPITNAEGYWTTRIGQLLDQSPAAVKRAVVPPLLAVALAGGTIAGSAAATEPGGNASPSFIRNIHVEDGDRIRTADQGDQIKTTKNNSQEYREGDINYFFEEPLPEPPDLDWIKDELSRLNLSVDQRFNTLDKSLEETNAAITEGLPLVESNVEKHVSQKARAIQRKIGTLDQPVQTTAAMTQTTLGNVNSLARPVQDTVRDLGTLTKNASEYAQQSSRDATTIQQNQEQQRTVVQRSLAQNAQSDSRGFLGRTFGRTLYQVGPLVVETMDARSTERHATKEEQDALHDALVAVQGSDPVHRRAFRDQLRTELLKRVEKPAQAYSILDKDFPSLLRICALPR